MAEQTKAQKISTTKRSINRAELKAHGLKRCYDCQQTKPQSSFSVDNSRGDGLQPRCKACYGIKLKRPAKPRLTEQQKDANKKNRSKRHRETNKQKLNEKSRRWLEENKVHFAQYAEKWRRENAEKIKVVSAKWRRENPEIIRSQIRNRRAKKKDAGGKHTANDIKNIFALQKGKCAHLWCRVSIKGSYHVDHVIPLKLGGRNDAKNLALLCPSCNLKKNAKHPIDFAQQNGMLL